MIQPDIGFKAEARSPCARWLQRAMLALVGSIAATSALSSPADDDAALLSLPQLIEIAQRDNRDLQAARYAIDIGRARLVQAGLLPNPRLDLSGRSDVVFANDGEYDGSVGISQQFPIAGRILRQKDLARVDLALAQAEVDEAVRQLAGDIAAAAYRLLVIDRRIESRDSLIGIETSLAQATRDRLKAAEVSELDVNTVQLDLQRLAQERALLQSQRQTQLIALNTLIGRHAASALAIDEPIPDAAALPARERLQIQALQIRPDLRSALLSADRAEAERALAKAQRWEDWSVALGLNQDKLVLDGTPPQRSSRAVAIGLTVPLPLFNKNQGLIAEAQANADQSRARIEALQLSITAEVSSAYAEASNLQQLVKQYRDALLPVSQRNVQLAQKGYSQGQVSIIEVVQSQRQLADLNANYLDMLEQFLQALVRLRTASAQYAGSSASPAIDNETEAH